jgi:O-antigen biosynthesis protein
MRLNPVAPGDPATEAPRASTARGIPASIPPASLIVCSRNRPGLLADAVASILRGEHVPAELIVVDQSDAVHPTLPALTTDRPVELRYLRTRSVGASRARNIGIAAARHDILVFCDDDILASASWLGSLVAALVAAGPRGIVTGQVRQEEPAGSDGFAPSTKIDDTPTVYTGRIAEDVLFTNNMALYRSALDAVGTFDERLGPGTRFPAAEDNDLGHRLLEAGYTITYAPEAVMYHRSWRTSGDYVPLYWGYGRGQGAFYAKYLGERDAHVAGRLARDVLRSLAGVLVQARRGRWLEARGHAAYALGILSGAAQWPLQHRPAR